MLSSVFRRRRDAEDITPVTTLLAHDGSPNAHLEHLKKFENMHKLDPNLCIEVLSDIDTAIATGNVEKSAEIEFALMEDNSPYAEVRGVVRNHDVDLPVATIRAWVIGMVLCTIGSAINMLFSLRYPNISVPTYVVQLIAYPIGLGWDLIMPDREWDVWGLKFNLRPGKFNFKEHTIIVAMSNASFGGGFLYATDALLAQKIYYKQDFGWAFQLLFGITSLCSGYGLAGLARRFLVWPAAMIWPANLVNCALFYSLHDHSHSDPTKTNGWSIGRYRLFLIVGSVSFFWYWIPGFLFKGLSFFVWVCWLAPKNIVVQKLFGGYHGYGLIPITFDWTVVSGYVGSPLIPPFHAIANVCGGIFVFYIAISMSIHFTGTWYAEYFPVQSSQSYDNTGQVYDVLRVLTDDFRLNETAYHEYSPLFLSTQFALAYGLSFAAVAAVLFHVALYHGKELWSQMKLARHQEDDIHMRLMKKYRDAEDWWYAVLYIVMTAMSIGVVVGWDTGFPIWAFFICMLLSIVWIIPVGIIQAVTNIQLGLNVIAEFIIGYMLPGRPTAMMMFKVYAYIVESQALFYAQDLKLGHYMKVPPRVLFVAQLVASLWSAITQICVMNWALDNIPGVCTSEQKNGYTCQSTQVFYTASVIWGVIGPARLFSKGALYSSLQWFWFVGAATPFATWFLARRWPKSFWRYVNMPVIFGGTSQIPPATVYTYLCWGVVGYIFNYQIRRRYTGWWLHYNYITSAALDCGLIVCTLLLFFTLSLTNNEAPRWWGNEAAIFTMDYKELAISKTLSPGEKIGPSQWV